MMDQEAIKKILPHREPFLFVDSILELTDKSAVGIKKLTTDDYFFKGHFPQKPVMPGVLMIEAMAQVGGVILLSHSGNRGKIAYFASIIKARFRRVVVPGDELRMEVEITKIKMRMGTAVGKATVNGEPACDAELMFALGD